MEKMKRTMSQKSSLKWRFLPYMAVMVVLLIVGIAGVGMGTSLLTKWLVESHASVEAQFYEPLESASGHTLYIQSGIVREWEDPRYKIFYELLNLSQYGVGALWAILCMAVPGILFYRRRLKVPLEVLTAASQKIGENDLDFTIHYQSSDEMGRLCASFERMRSLLEENQKEMWRQMGDRKRLNAAFSHDLRTPLTVLKGQSEMILKYAPDGRMSQAKVLSTVEMMQKHILRLEQYTYTMNHLQKLEDIEVSRAAVPLSTVAAAVEETGSALRGTRAFSLEAAHGNGVPFDGPDSDPVLALDMNLLMQVLENLLANSVRYAKTKVYARLSMIEKNVPGQAGRRLLILTVGDDGDGFDENMLARGVTPFYSTEKDSQDCHFGMGLAICRILCEKHGGSLKIYNQGGGCVQAAFDVEASAERMEGEA